MIIKNMTISNSRGDSITFDRYFRLVDDFSLSGLTATVNYINGTTDGSHYQNTVLDNKDFEVPFFIVKEMTDAWWIEEKRNDAYKVFNPKVNPMRIDIVTKGGEEYYLNANLEGAPLFPTGFENNNQEWQRGLLQFSANDPYFYSKKEEKVDIALWVPDFEFPLEIPEEGIEMGHRDPSLIVNALNEGQESTGMLVRFRALGTLLNPSLVNVNTYESIKLNTTMIAGDVIEVSTYKRRKRVYLIRNAVKSDAFNSLDLSSKFLQLEIGDNLFRFDAEEGLNNLEVSLTFTPKLLGV
ncbi:phage tail family protein [Cytobacillus sp. IB215316]|uniref:phage tail family protein n=1 Tax=Cytobacillus sp. IB215316 TaxID=3097354 RepID=UPI002A122377|nr:phage tail family protein [Cytobacillus sp. IB215316]MDX8359829.1 phage tail family protein [Cytobacillus sp. IB215316]